MQVDTACVARRLFVFLKAQEVHWQNQKIPSFLRRDFKAEVLEFLNPRLKSTPDSGKNTLKYTGNEKSTTVSNPHVLLL